MHKVLLTNFGTRLSFQTALALQEANLLERYLTGYYYREDEALCKLIQALPARARNRLENELKRRFIPGLDASNVLTRAFPEFCFVFAKRAPIPAALRNLIFDWRYNNIQAFFANTIRARSPHAVVAVDGWALQTFRACEKVGALKILDQNTGHVVKAKEIMDAEMELHPEFAESIPAFPADMVERCREEALMADHITMSSDYARQTLLDIGVDAARIHHIPYGANISRFFPLESKFTESSKTRPTRFLFVGNLSQRKGIKYLLEAFKQIKNENIELQLVGPIIGTGKGLRAYEDLFEYIPSIPHHLVHSYFQNADVLVYPSLHESGVMAIHEALACAVPVITTPNAGSVVRDGLDGFIVPIRDVDALVEKMLELHRNKELRRTMGLAARKSAEMFTWEAYRKKFGEVIRQIVTSPT